MQYLVRAVVDGHAFRAATTTGERAGDRPCAPRPAARGNGRGSPDRPAPRRGPPGRRGRRSTGPRRHGHAGRRGRPARGAALVRRRRRLRPLGARVRGPRRHGAGRGGRRRGGGHVRARGGAAGRGRLRAAAPRLTAATEAYGSLTATRRRRHQPLDRPVPLGAAAAASTRPWPRRSRSPPGPAVGTALEPGTYPVVLGPEAVGELLQFLPELGFSGDLAARRHRPGRDPAPGSRWRPTAVDVADDALADVGLPIGFDIEGVGKRRVAADRPRAGRRAPVTDRATARALGTAPTGHAHIAREQVPAPEAANIVMAAAWRPTSRTSIGRRSKTASTSSGSGTPGWSTDRRHHHRRHPRRLLPHRGRPADPAARRHAVHRVGAAAAWPASPASAGNGAPNRS